MSGHVEFYCIIFQVILIAYVFIQQTKKVVPIYFFTFIHLTLLSKATYKLGKIQAIVNQEEAFKNRK